MTELQRMKALRIRYRHFGKLQRRLAGDPVQRTLCEEYVVFERGRAHELEYSLRKCTQQLLRRGAQLALCQVEIPLICDSASKGLKPHQHGRKRARHHGTLLISR